MKTDELISEIERLRRKKNIRAKNSFLSNILRIE